MGFKLSNFKNAIGPGSLIAAAFIGPGTVTVCTFAGVNFGFDLQCNIDRKMDVMSMFLNKRRCFQDNNFHKRERV